MRLRFGSFTLDDDTRQVLRGDADVHLSPKAFELLKLLAAARPKALSKADIHEALWPETFVSEANLAVLIKEIRAALDDSARQPRFIRTVHGFGYAFAATGAAMPAAGTQSCWLISRERKFALAEGDNLIGRSPEAGVWLDVPGLSREHARVTIAGGTATLEDLRSMNGTYRGGERVTSPVRLGDGDRLQFGPVLMVFRVWSPGAGSRTQELSDGGSPAN